jgi:hypothetical protein
MFAHTTNAAEWRRPWRESNVEFARRLWSQLNTDAQRFLTTLIQVPTNEFTAAEVGERLHPPRPANRVQTLLGQAGTFCKKQGLQQIWRFRYPTPGSPARYSMDTVPAELLQYALRLPPPSPDDFFTGDLFDTIEVNERGEQRRLRKLLLDKRETATCALCGREFPRNFSLLPTSSDAAAATTTRCVTWRTYPCSRALLAATLSSNAAIYSSVRTGESAHERYPTNRSVRTFRILTAASVEPSRLGAPRTSGGITRTSSWQGKFTGRSDDFH